MPRGSVARTAEQVREVICQRTITTPDGCWLWTGNLSNSGYAQMSWKVAGSVVSPGHRVSYAAFIGPIPDGKQLDHLCRNRPCVRPEHLEPVTAMENIWASGQTIAGINGAKTTCPAGHPYDEKNTYLYGPRRTWRACRTCTANHHARYRTLKKAS